MLRIDFIYLTSPRICSTKDFSIFQIIGSQISICCHSFRPIVGNTKDSDLTYTSQFEPHNLPGSTNFDTYIQLHIIFIHMRQRHSILYSISFISSVSYNLLVLISRNLVQLYIATFSKQDIQVYTQAILYIGVLIATPNIRVIHS